MKLLIASDIHGDKNSALALKNAFQTENADKIILLGDILYHGPRNSLPDAYDPKEVADILNGIKEYILAVKGNCDTEVDQMVLQFPILADYAYISDENLTIFATHGHKYNADTPPLLSRGDILLHGHTHIPAFERFGNWNIYVNPGSLTVPKGGNPKTYMIYESGKFILKSIEGKCIVEYEANE